ncbi:MAG: SHD1 domain-containing protein [Novipirellula sp. JB048]
MLPSIVLALSSPAVARGPLRIWVDRTGLHSIEASLQSITDGVVRLRRPNGSRVTIAVDQLSQVDQDYLASWSDRSAHLENHLRRDPPELPELPPQPILKLPAASNRLDEGQPLAPLSGPAPPAMDAFAGPLLPDPQPFTIALPFARQAIGKIHAFDTCSPPLAITTPTQTFLAVSISTGLNSSTSPGSNRILRFDPASGRVATLLRSSQPITILDHDHASGRTLVLDGHHAMGQGGELAIVTGWDQETLSIENRRALPAIVSANPPVGMRTRHLHWARWVDGEHVIASINDEIAVWNLISGECLHRVCTLANKATPAISAGRRYVAVPRSRSIELYQTSDGARLGAIPVDSDAIAQVRFSPRGDSLAIITRSSLRVWELSSATLRGEVRTQRSLGKGAPIWIDTDLVLSSNGLLLSIDRGVPIWRYDLLGSTIDALGVSSPRSGIAILRRRPEGEIGVIELPHSTVWQALPWVHEQQRLPRSGRWEIPGRSELGEAGWADRDLRFTRWDEAER